jgi:hypothetical protein
MMQISSDSTQVKLNMERLKAVRERLQQNQASAVGKDPIGTSASQAAFALPASSSPSGPSIDSLNRSASPLTKPTEANTPSLAVQPLSPDLIQQDYDRFQKQARSQKVASPLNETRASLPSLQGQYGLPVGDIQSIAKQVGFVGVDQASIERAYAYRKSLFVDIKI